MFHTFGAALSLYCDMNKRRQIATELTKMKHNHIENNIMDSPLAESSVTVRLSLIQRRCNELMDQTDGLELTLEDPEPIKDSGDPYNHLK